MTFGLPNIVLVQKGYQKNKTTGFVRPVQRVVANYASNKKTVNATPQNLPFGLSASSSSASNKQSSNLSGFPGNRPVISTYTNANQNKPVVFGATGSNLAGPSNANNGGNSLTILLKLKDVVKYEIDKTGLLGCFSSNNKINYLCEK